MFKLLIIIPLLWLFSLAGLSYLFLPIVYVSVNHLNFIIIWAYLIACIVFLILSSFLYVTDDEQNSPMLIKELAFNSVICSVLWLCSLLLMISLDAFLDVIAKMAL